MHLVQFFFKTSTSWKALELPHLLSWYLWLVLCFTALHSPSHAGKILSVEPFLAWKPLDTLTALPVLFEGPFFEWSDHKCVCYSECSSHGFIQWHNYGFHFLLNFFPNNFSHSSWLGFSWSALSQYLYYSAFINVSFNFPNYFPLNSFVWRIKWINP